MDQCANLWLVGNKNRGRRWIFRLETEKQRNVEWVVYVAQLSQVLVINHQDFALFNGGIGPLFLPFFVPFLSPGVHRSRVPCYPPVDQSPHFGGTPLRPLQNWDSFPRPGLRPDIGSSNIPGHDNLPQNLPDAQKICSKICSLAPRLPILFINRVVIGLYSIIVPTFSSSSSSLNTAEIGLYFFSWIIWKHIFTTLSSFQTHHKIIMPTSRRLS